jgi:ABC-type uncharacterized transport system substrate-binding protein
LRARSSRPICLRELVPAASRFGLLVNPNNENAEAITGDLKAAAATIGVEIDVVRATDSREIKEAFVARAFRGSPGALRSRPQTP